MREGGAEEMASHLYLGGRVVSSFGSMIRSVTLYEQLFLLIMFQVMKKT